MATLFLLQTQKRYAMINKVSLTIIGRKHSKSISVNAQVFVNGEKDVIPLSIKVEPKFWDERARLVKAQHPQALDLNAVINNAFDRASSILKDANVKSIRLNKQSFRDRFTSAINDADFVAFWRSEHEARKGTIEYSTWKQQKSSLKKFVGYRSSLPFDMLSAKTLEDYERYLIKKGNTINTIACALKNVKTYINLAIKSGVDIKNPFTFHKIKTGRGKPTFLEVDELRKLLDMYFNGEIATHLQESLLIFLVQAFTSLRISDAMAVTESWVPFGNLEFEPYKNRKLRKRVSFGLSKIASKLLRELLALKRQKKLKTEKQINVDLKLIAATAGIKKNLTTHVARHTFATTFISIGGDVVVLKDIMGHSKIETTMVYVHLVDKRKTEQMGNFDIEFK